MATFVHRRPLAPKETDYEVLLVGLTAAIGAFASLWLHCRLSTPSCPFAHLTGLPCPTCGGTRAVRALLAGNFRAAFRWNPLVVTAFSALGAMNVYAAVVVIFRLPRVRFGPFPKKLGNVFRILGWTAILLNWGYLVFTLPVGGH